MSIDMTRFNRAPSHKKPKLPPMADVAAMIVAGELLEDIAADYTRSVATFRLHLNNAGYNSATGFPLVRDSTIASTLPRIPFNNQPWAEDALCVQTDPEAFFPDKGGTTREAKRVCLSCEVRTECLDYALDNDERYGVWGGMSERERRRIKKGQAPVHHPAPADQVIRAWAHDQGVRVPPVGRVSAKLVEAYLTAHPEAS